MKHGSIALALAISVMVIGCELNPSIEVEFRIPEAYRDVVTHTVLQVYVPPSGNAFGCDDLAFGEVDDVVLEASLVEELESGDQKLEGVDRKKTKLFVAWGYTAQEVAAVVGCESLGVVVGNRKLVITGEPTVSASPLEEQLLMLTGGDGLPETLSLRVQDVLDDPIPGVPLRWTTVGPGGERFDGTDATDAAGEVVVEPQLPKLPGPAVMDVRLRWQRFSMPLISAFQLPQDNQAVVLSPSETPGQPGTSCILDSALGTIGDGEDAVPAIASLALVEDMSSSTSTRIVVDLVSMDLGTGALLSRRIPIDTSGIPGLDGLDGLSYCMDEVEFPAAALTMGTIRRGGKDRFVVVGAGTWLELETEGEPTFVEMSAYALTENAAPLSVQAIGPCYPDTGDSLVLIAREDGSAGVYDGTGQEVSHPFEGIWADGVRGGVTGCVADSVADREYPAVMLSTAYMATTLYVLVDEVQPPFEKWFSQWVYAVGFTPRLDQNEPSALLVGEMGSGALEIARYRFNPQDDVETSWLEKTAVDPVLAAPSVLVAGNMDGQGNGDPLVDVVSVISVPTPVGDGQIAIESYVHGIVGALYKGERVAGTFHLGALYEATNMETELALGGGRYRIWLADMDHNGADDLVVLNYGVSWDAMSPMGVLSASFMGE